jgi:hypothetical protein
VDLKQLAGSVCPDYELGCERVMAPWGRLVRLRQPETTLDVEIEIAVYESVQEAEDGILALLASVAPVFQRVDPAVVALGDSGNCWRYQSGPGAHVEFVRRNAIAVVTVYGAPSTEVMEEAIRIAAAVDEQIADGSVAVELAKTVPIPVLQRLAAPQSVRLGQSERLEVEAVDPSGGRLDLFALDGSRGVSATRSESPGIYVVEGREPGTHEVVVGAITAKCVVATWSVQVTVH